MHIHEHLGCDCRACRADGDGGFAPVAGGVCLDEFTCSDAFELGLLCVEALQSVCGAVGLPKEHVVEVHVAGKLCAVKVDADSVYLREVCKGELAVFFTEFNLVVLEFCEVRNVTEAEFFPIPAAAHVEERDASPTVFAATIAGEVRATACGFAINAHVEGNSDILAPALADVDTHRACFGGVGLNSLVGNVEGHVTFGNRGVFFDCRIDSVTRECGLTVSFAHGVQCFDVGDVAHLALVLVRLAADNRKVAIAFVTGVPNARNEAVLLCGCDGVAVPSSACFEVLFEVVAGEEVETLDGAHFADHNRNALVVEAGLESAE